MTDLTVRSATALHLAVFLAMLGGLAVAGLSFDDVTSSTWWTAFLVVNVGVFAGNLAMLTLATSPSAERRLLAEGRREDLEDSRRVVVEQLRALEADRDKLDPADYARERAALVAVGTSASRELDEGVPTAAESTLIQAALAAGGPPTAPAATVPGVPPSTPELLLRRLQADRDAQPEAFEQALAQLGYRRAGPDRAWVGAAWTLAAVGLIAVLYVGAGDASRSREVGEPITGGTSMGAPPEGRPAPASAGRSAEIAELEQRVAADPTDLDALNRLSGAAAARRDLPKLMQLNEQALSVAPADPDARAYRGVLQLAIGQRAEAKGQFDAILAEHPQHVLSLLMRSQLVLDTAPAQSVDDLATALTVDDDPKIRAMYEEAKERAGTSAPAEVLVSGTLDLPSGGADAGYQAVFVSLRPDGGGPPLATLKLAPGPFPLSFHVTEKNRMRFGPMANRPVPDAFTVRAWLDADGDPLTKGDDDPFVEQAAVAKGTTSAALVLQ